MVSGPGPMDRAQRLALAYEIAGRVQRHYGGHVLALGVYGSVARGTPGPFSDIEMHCVLRSKGFERAHEWSAGAWKAEVDVYSEDVILRWASLVDGDWPITHGAFVDVLTIFDPTDFFPRLRVAALSQPDHAFQRAIQDVIVGEIFERVGKIRNARVSENDACLPYLAFEIAKYGACLIGLANRQLYTSSYHLFTDSLALPHRPNGYDALCQIVMAGELSDPSRIEQATDGFWYGIEGWAREWGILIEEDMETVLRRQPWEPDGL